MNVARKRGKAGETNPSAKLSDSQINDLLARYTNGENTQAELSREFNVSASHVCRVVNGCVRNIVTAVPKVKEHALPSGASLIPGWSGYCVTDQGQVYTQRLHSGKVVGPWRVKKTVIDGDGYCRTRLCSDQRSCFVGVHSLVLLAFVGEPPAGCAALHRNGIRSDNDVGNLYWGTPQNNADDRDRHGNTAVGETNGNSKLTNDVVGRMKLLREEGCSFQKIADVFGVDKSTARRAVVGETWNKIAKRGGVDCQR